MFIGVDEYYNVSMSQSPAKKSLHRKIIWAYYFLRNVTHYGSIEVSMLWNIYWMVSLQDMTGQIYEEYIQKVLA